MAGTSSREWEIPRRIPKLEDCGLDVQSSSSCESESGRSYQLMEPTGPKTKIWSTNQRGKVDGEKLQLSTSALLDGEKTRSEISSSLWRPHAKSKTGNSTTPTATELARSTSNSEFTEISWLASTARPIDCHGPHHYLFCWNWAAKRQRLYRYYWQGLCRG